MRNKIILINIEIVFIEQNHLWVDAADPKKLALFTFWAGILGLKFNR